MRELKEEEALKFFDALSHPIRIRILKVLLEGERYISELAKELGISRPLLYMHLSKLEKAGIITTYIKYFDKPPYVRKFVKAKTIKVELILPELIVKMIIEDEVRSE